MTHQLKDATEEEFEIAKKAAWFSRMVHKWWIKNGQKGMLTDSPKEWEGTVAMAAWCRKELTRKITTRKQ